MKHLPLVLLFVFFFFNKSITAGFLHEQNREERDQYINIQYQNIQRGYEQNFQKAQKGSTSGFGVGYDYGSVMHYSANAFSVNGQPTIVTKVTN